MDLKKIFGILELVLFIYNKIRKKQAPSAPQKEADETPEDVEQRVS